MTYATRFFSRWWAVIAVVLVWQFGVLIFNISPFLMPSPLKIITEMAGTPETFLIPLLMTLRTAITGFVIGVGCGFLAASIAWLLPIFGTMLTPLALVIRSVPFVALIPVLATIFGYSSTTAWIICAMVCFFPTFVLVRTGLSDVPANGNDLFTVAGASRMARYRLLAAPSSLISLATSTRISAGVAFTAALVGEFLMGVPGLSSVLTNALAELNMTTLWGTSLCAIIIGILAYLGANQIERYALKRLR